MLITGWYGTETVGDKAILGELLHQYASERPDCRILVTSLYPFITRRTLRELGSDAEVIPLYSWSCLKTAAAARIVCVGGGPLMELELLAVPLWLLSAARANGGQTVLHGCGIGPLLSAKRTDAVRKILALSDRILLRDRAGAAWARELSGRDDVACVGDPAERYLRRTYPKTQQDDKRPVLACFLREPTEEYRGTMTCEEFRLFRESFEAGLAENIKALARREQLDIRFYSMHNFCVGGDDRDFAFRFAQKHFEPGSYWVDNQLTGIEPVVQAMNRARICLCMRFHSVLFADTLEAEYLAIDYTGGGKIHGYLKDHDQLRRLVGMRDLLRGENVLLDAAREAGICKP
ncbi:hypothetical protein SDC9_60627 [bioreactor metagenome]|uniref:Polysaccharide pyruvyl transferase domain-containing protein n=1 Tax=bioreactor metagenome TaxID=1076179 RepID=A0A644XDI9_9ZZZZ